MSRRLAAVVALVALSGPVFAHHGAPALYDVANPITIKGVVTEFIWANPHAQFFLDVKDERGNVVNWAVETNTPAQLRRAGWTRTTLKPGDVIEVRLIPAKSGAPVGFSGYALAQGHVKLANGQILTTQEKPEYGRPAAGSAGERQ